MLSEYGITDARRPVDVNRALRRAGLLNVYTQAGMEYLDPWTSRAFAVADHQIAHVYVRDPADVAGRARGARRAAGDRPRARGRRPRAPRASATSARASSCSSPSRDAWFTYYYWLDDERAPDFARQVEIHRKPGYDPAELFMDPEDKLVKARAGAALVRKKIGMRYVMRVVPLDPEPVRGTHGRLPDVGRRRAGAALLRRVARARPDRGDRRARPAARARGGAGGGGLSLVSGVSGARTATDPLPEANGRERCLREGIGSPSALDRCRPAGV